MELGCKHFAVVWIYFFLSGFFSGTLAILRGAGEGRGLSFSLFHFHLLKNIHAFIFCFIAEITTSIFNRYSWIWMIECWFHFTCRFYTRSCYSNFPDKRWIWARIAYDPIITNNRTNEMTGYLRTTHISV